MSGYLRLARSLCRRAGLYAVVCSLFLTVFAEAKAQRKASSSRPVASALIVQTEPNATIWLNDVRCGTTDGQGNLRVGRVPAGSYLLRVRARGFKEASLPVRVPSARAVRIRLARTNDQAELAFQQAEELRERAKSEEERRRAVELYRRAISARPRFAAAHVGLARALMDLGDYDAALAEVAAARRARPVYPEASAVEGRVLRALGDYDAALNAYRRAIREGRGFQPEAHTGIGMILEDRGRYEEAVAAFKRAIAQLFDTEPVLYQLLGSAYEKMEKYKEAVAAYERYLELAPNGNFAPAIRSIIEQLRQQASGNRALPF
ncbi:tetratricopeptide repeat protein [Pyrinomonas sp.]|uniref:tetratricopeptide repeat protein n=1 Tax=Pyrinomonas sp. TaxID=2080306 RepID=UPI003333108E